MSCINNKKIEEAREQLEKIKADEVLMEIIRHQEIAEWDENTRIANAEERGMKKGKKQIALNLLKLNIPIDQIVEATGLSTDEIKKLKETLCN